jgi:hypothetical protein
MNRCILLVGILLCAVLGRAAVPTVLRVVDLRWIEGQPELEVWLGSLQGAINRQEGDAAVLLVRSEEDAGWADALVAAHELKKEVLTPGAFLELCKPMLTGQVLYDPAQPWTRNIALTAAAISPGTVIVTDTPRNLPIVLDLRAGWTDRRQAYARAAEQFGQAVDMRTLALAPDDGHLLGDLITARKLLAVGLSPFDQQDAALLHRLLAAVPDGGQVIGHPGSDDVEVAAVRGALARLHENRPLSYLPARDAANLSCFARFPVTRPLVQFREDAPKVETSGTVALIYNLGATVGAGTQTLDYAATSLPRLLDDLTDYRVPVGVEVPTEILEAAPSLYELALTRSRATAVELIAAPGADPMRARQMDLSVVSVRGEPGEWPTTAAMLAIARAGWQGAFVQPLARADDPAWLTGGGLPAEFPVVLASRVSSVTELRTALGILKGPNQVIYLDPNGVPPALLRDMMPEIERTHTVVTPSQLLRTKREIDAMEAYVRANNLTKFTRRAPTLRVSAPAVPAEISDAREIRAAVRIDGAAPVVEAHIAYLAPDGRPGVAELRPAGQGQWIAALPPMLTGGDLPMRARVVEGNGFGETITPSVTVRVISADTDRDGLTDTLEAYLGSDPRNQDTDGDGLPDGLDERPTRPDRPVAEYFTPVMPPADGSMLTDAGASKLEADCRVVPVGSSITYRIPVDGIPTAGVTLRLRTEGSGIVSMNRAAPVDLRVTSAGNAETDLPVIPAHIAGGTLRITLTAGATPLYIYQAGLISNPDGPYLPAAQFSPEYPPAGMPLAVRVIAFSPDGVKAARLRYGDSAGRLETVELTPVAGGGNVLFTGTMPAQSGGRPLVYGIEAQDEMGRVAASPYRVMAVGRTRGHSVALVGGRDLHGTWSPASLWGAWGRVAHAGAEDSHLFLARPGAYHLWVLAQPRTRGIEVSVAEGSSLTGKPETMLAKAAPAGSADGWYKLGTFNVEASRRLRVTVRPAGNAGYCAYGAVVLTQDPGLTPPLRYAGIDWFNSITLRGLTSGQEVKDKISVTAQATGNIDIVTVAAHRVVRDQVSDEPEKRFEQRDANYLLDSRDLRPGEYAIVATGWRIIDEKTGRVIDPLISTSVRVVVPGR